MKLHIKKGDMVQVIAGDNKGQQGKVLKVEAEKQRAIVEGVNLCKKATKPNAQNPQETRPLSKTKRWRLVQIIERAK